MFQEPDTIFGHVGGTKLSVPNNYSDLEFATSLKPAPDIGEWFVITTESKYFHELPEETKNEWLLGQSTPVSDKFQVTETAEPFKHRFVEF